jgi:hypothetical protein
MNDEKTLSHYDDDLASVPVGDIGRIKDITHGGSMPVGNKRTLANRDEGIAKFIFYTRGIAMSEEVIPHDYQEPLNPGERS